MNLITPQLIARFNSIGRQDASNHNTIVVCKFVAPWLGFTWYAIEYNPSTQTFFGIVDSPQAPQFDYFYLPSLEGVVGPGDQTVIRDITWEEKPLGDVICWVFDSRLQPKERRTI
jgi:hypothetical protein